MTTYRGKRTDRNVVDHKADQRLLCCWLDCEKYGFESYKAREYLGFDPRGGGPIFTFYVFCSERHKMYWVNSTRDHFNLPPGYRLAVI